MIEISTEDYPGQYSIKEENQAIGFYKREIFGAKYLIQDKGELKIALGKIYLDQEYIGSFEKGLLPFYNLKEFVVGENKYHIIETEETINPQKAEILCKGSTVATVEYEGYSRILFKERNGWVKISGYNTSHLLACLISLYFFEQEVCPSENG
ncbi:hypothetical protein ACJJI4_18760 [Microbulbifer sp. TRSA002]|uniref:hypothetical protein n=1 Tax=Microbulbifer sp. TRSA002 TaxID=3243382 RepID=UPI00403A6EA5